MHIAKSQFSLDEYQALVVETAVYPDKLWYPEIWYPALGIAGEFGEFVAACTEETIQLKEVISEMGDVLWYIAALCRDLDLRLSEVVGHEHFDYLDHKYPADYAATFREVGRICECCKKIFRDGNLNKIEGVKQGIRSVMRDLHNFLRSLVVVFPNDQRFPTGITMAQVAKWNVDKFQDRAKRQVLQGDGDNR